MDGRIHIYSSLKVIYPEREVFFRLGGNLFHTGLSAEQRDFYSGVSARAFELCLPAGRWCVKKIDSIDDKKIIFCDGSSLVAGKFINSTEGAEYIWFGAAGVGGNIVSSRDALQEISSGSIYDAVASETADAAMDMVHRMAGKELMRCGLHLSEARFSPGYGNMPLEMQKLFFEFLKLEDMGISLTDNFFMIPEKSVTAVAAVL